MKDFVSPPIGSTWHFKMTENSCDDVFSLVDERCESEHDVILSCRQDIVFIVLGDVQRLSDKHMQECPFGHTNEDIEKTWVRVLLNGRVGLLHSYWWTDGDAIPTRLS